jgi:hypothetical protein
VLPLAPRSHTPHPPPALVLLLMWPVTVLTAVRPGQSGQGSPSARPFPLLYDLWHIGGGGGGEWIELAEDWGRRRAVVNAVMNLGVVGPRSWSVVCRCYQIGTYLTQIRPCPFAPLISGLQFHSHFPFLSLSLSLTVLGPAGHNSSDPNCSVASPCRFRDFRQFEILSICAVMTSRQFRRTCER